MRYHFPPSQSRGGQRFWQIFLGVVLGLTLVGSLTRLTCPPVLATSRETTISSQQKARVFDTVCRLVERRYYDPTLHGTNWRDLTQQFRRQALAARDEAALYNTINQLLARLEDQHTFALPPSRVREEKQGTRAGIGIQLRKLEGQWVVTHTLGGSAAYEAGIRPGWIVAEVNGQPFTGFKPGQRFQSGQSVKLKLLDANDRPKWVEVICRPFATAPEQRAQYLPDGILYLRFTEFASKTDDWLEEHITANPQATGLIFDLRENTGGLLDVLTACLRLIYRQDVVLGDFIQRNQKPLRLRISGNRQAFTGPVLVLVDEHSASAAEIFAAAVQDTARGTVIGRRTAGAVLASIQEPLPDGGKVQISIRDYRTARGVRLESQGVTPDVPVKLTLEDVRRNVDVDFRYAMRQLALTLRRQEQGSELNVRPGRRGRYEAGRSCRLPVSVWAGHHSVQKPEPEANGLDSQSLVMANCALVL
ncbi:MAG: S41 family peptidase [Acidobacteriota bacterium]